MSQSAIIAGSVPATIRVNLTTGADFLWGPLRYANGDPFETGAVLKLEWDNGTTWTATMAGDMSSATFSEESATADAIDHGTAVRFTKTVSTFNETLALGTAVRRG